MQIFWSEWRNFIARHSYIFRMSVAGMNISVSEKSSEEHATRRYDCCVCDAGDKHDGDVEWYEAWSLVPSTTSSGQCVWQSGLVVGKRSIHYSYQWVLVTTNGTVQQLESFNSQITPIFIAIAISRRVTFCFGKMCAKWLIHCTFSMFKRKFLPCDCEHIRTVLLSTSVCPAVYLSVYLTNAWIVTKGNKSSVHIWTPYDRAIFLVSWG